MELDLPSRVWTAVTAEVFGDDRSTTPTIETFPYSPGSPATGGLWRAKFPSADGERSVFVKLVQDVRLWPGLAGMPPGMAEHFVALFPWRFEYDIIASGIDETLPDGMRSPGLHHVYCPDEQHIYLFFEFVETQTVWNHEMYARTACLLGRMAARRRVGLAVNDSLPAVSHGELSALRMYVERAVVAGHLPPLERPWTTEPFTRYAPIRSRLLQLAPQIPALLDHLDTLPQTFVHGDASPQNLLVPVDSPTERVVIDWGFGTPCPIGFDLGQLLVGLAHAGEVDAADLPGIHSVIVPAYLDGLAAEGWEPGADVVQQGYLVSLALRSAFASLKFDGTPTEIESRLRLTETLLDLTESACAVGASN